MPSGEGIPYGYGVLASIPEGIAVQAPLKEMNVPGGLYASFESSDDIGGSWKKLMQNLTDHEEYTPDRSRLCFEEFIRNDAPEGSGHDYFLNLLEPVKRK
jgi:DNA gyrase inhibitor GyrI